MGNVFFKPWVGKEYANPQIFSKRIMILGESHHCKELDEKKCNLVECAKRPVECQDFTCDVVNRFLLYREYENWFITYIKFEQALSGKKLQDGERDKLWNSIMFYNYTQVPMEHPGQRPSSEQIRYSDRGFSEVFDQYKPEIIITWGRNIFNAISVSKEQTIVSIHVLDKIFNLPTFVYDLPNDKKCIVFPIYHPASPRFSPTYWNKVIKHFI